MRNIINISKEFLIGQIHFKKIVFKAISLDDIIANIIMRFAFTNYDAITLNIHTI